MPGVHGDGGEVAAVNEPLEVRRAAVETQSEGEQVRSDDDLQLGVEGDDEAVREHVEERAVFGRAEQVGNGRARNLRRRQSREVNGPEAAIGVARAQIPYYAARLWLEAVLADGNEPGPPTVAAGRGVAVGNARGDAAAPASHGRCVVGRSAPASARVTVAAGRGVAVGNARGDAGMAPAVGVRDAGCGGASGVGEGVWCRIADP